MAAEVRVSNGEDSQFHATGPPSMQTRDAGGTHTPAEVSQARAALREFKAKRAQRKSERLANVMKVHAPATHRLPLLPVATAPGASCHRGQRCNASAVALSHVARAAR